MYQVPYGSNGPEKNKYGAFCIAGSGCAKCPWFIKKSRSSITVLGKKKTVQTSICGFNKKQYDDMQHRLVMYDTNE
ncbi:MAG: hypothetical protein LBB47_07340 [Spirochaetaceae bacterium]|jgi:hypothetical protein|nr:hypothetical protein [Spirochaetaceae bacterium]